MPAQTDLKPAIFLDRDGTLNYDSGYTHKISDWRWLPGALSGLALLRDAGWPLVVVSNQSGIARGYYNHEQLKELETWVCQDLAKHEIKMAGWYYCPHGPTDNCNCRKPKPGLILAACRDLGLDPARSWLIGDRVSDIKAALAAGCNAALVGNPAYPDEEQEAREICPGLVYGENLETVAEILTAATGPNRLAQAPLQKAP